VVVLSCEVLGAESAQGSSIVTGRSRVRRTGSIVEKQRCDSAMLFHSPALWLVDLNV
jgi:hypothetical protein